MTLPAKLPAGDFRNTRWRMTKDKVWAAERKATFLSEERPFPGIWILHYQDDLEGASAEILYHFDALRLVKGEYVVKSIPGVESEYFRKVYNAVNKDYGFPHDRLKYYWQTLSSAISLSKDISGLTLEFTSRKYLSENPWGDADFRQAAWGMSTDQIKGLEKKAAFKEGKSETRGRETIRYQGKIGGDEAIIRYCFSHGKLILGIYHFFPDKRPVPVIYNRIKKLLTERYGKPISETEKRRPKEGGKIEKTAFWETKRSTIYLKQQSSMVMIFYNPPENLILKNVSGESDRLMVIEQGKKGQRFTVERSEKYIQIEFSTYLGGSSRERCGGITVDNKGDLYVTGYTASFDFPVHDAYQSQNNQPDGSTGTDLFVSKLSSTGSSLLYSTYLGGSLSDKADDIAVDTALCAYITGYTESLNFPTVNPFQASIGHEGGSDPFVTKISSTGSALVYSTYVGGFAYDMGGSIAVDETGAAYVTGRTYAKNFPVTQGSYDLIYSGRWDVFILKLNSEGNDLVYSTYLGGRGDEESRGIALDSMNRAYVTGYTDSKDFPYQKLIRKTAAKQKEIFIVALDPAGSSLDRSIILGGSADDEGRGITINSAGDILIAGVTESPDFPTRNSYQAGFGGGSRDVVVLQLPPTGRTLTWSTYLGGSGKDEGNDIVVDETGASYITGSSASYNFPAVKAYQSLCVKSEDAFVAILTSSGSTLMYSTLLGGSRPDQGIGISRSSTGLISVAGNTSSKDFPIKNALQRTLAGSSDIFVTKFKFADPAAKSHP